MCDNNTEARSDTALQRRVREGAGDLIATPIDESVAGWRYKGSGEAVSIPQARSDGEKNEAAALLSKRSCVQSYPTQA